MFFDDQIEQQPLVTRSSKTVVCATLFIDIFVNKDDNITDLSFLFTRILINMAVLSLNSENHGLSCHYNCTGDITHRQNWKRNHRVESN